MKTPICEKLGIEYPIFAFTHCRDVAVAVSKAGGMGVFGVLGFTPEQVKQELDWIDAHIGDKNYAVDIVIPQKYEGKGEMDPVKLQKQLEGLSYFVGPHLARLESRYLARLEKMKFGAKERRALNLMTPGAALRFLEAGGKKPLFGFLEQVEYNARRLAKLNLDPQLVIQAMVEYDRLLVEVLRKVDKTRVAELRFRWAREQIHFCVVLTLNNSYFQVREVETRAHSELFRIEIESRSLDELLAGSLDVLARYCRADAARVFLLDEANGEWRLQDRKAAFRVPSTQRRKSVLSKGFCWVEPEASRAGLGVLDPEWLEKYPTVWSMPLINGRRLAGVMQFGFSKPYEWLPREQDMLSLVAERCLLGAEKVKLMQDLAESENQLRMLASRMIQVEEVERRRISRELHDEAGQDLLYIRLQLEMLEGMLPEDLAEARSKTAEVRQMTEQTILEIRRLIAALSPAVLEQLGLAPGLRQLVARFQRLQPRKVELNLGDLSGLPRQTQAVVYRLVQECLNNIAKHSQATNVKLAVETADGLLQVSVEDNGVGFRLEEALAQQNSFGLSGMRERVTLLGGLFRIESHPAGALGPVARRSRRERVPRRPAGGRGSAPVPRLRDRPVGHDGLHAQDGGRRGHTQEARARLRCVLARLSSRHDRQARLRPRGAGQAAPRHHLHLHQLLRRGWPLQPPRRLGAGGADHDRHPA